MPDLQAINGLRDAAQHHLLDISEQHLYLQAQGGLTLFRGIYKSVFNRDLHECLPSRVLPLSTTPPTDLASMFATEIDEVRRLLNPKARRRIEATAKMRALAILEAAVGGHRVQPSQFELEKLADQVQRGTAWDQLFPGVASLELTSKGHGPSLDLRIAKKEGIPVQLVPDGTPGATVVAIRRVDELGFYNLSLRHLAKHLGLSAPRTIALIRFTNVEADAEAFKQVVLGKSIFKRYSQKALTLLEKAKTTVDYGGRLARSRAEGQGAVGGPPGATSAFAARRARSLGQRWSIDAPSRAPWPFDAALRSPTSCRLGTTCVKHVFSNVVASHRLPWQYRARG